MRDIKKVWPKTATMEKQDLIEHLLSFRRTILAICIGFTKTPEVADELLNLHQYLDGKKYREGLLESYQKRILGIKE